MEKGVTLSKEKSNKLLYSILTTSFAIVWIWAAIHPLHFNDWLIENFLVLLTVPLIFYTSKYFKFSNTSYIMITFFMILHVIGSHYTYSEVPFGVTLGEWWETERNMYDRLVHLLFGVLFVYPLFELLKGVAKINGFWTYFVAFMVMSAFAGFYEVFEWVGAQIVDPEAGAAFLGTQGDEWDAQKDMALAMVGSLFMLTIISFQNKSKELLS